MPRKRNLGPNSTENVRAGRKSKHNVSQKEVDRLQKQGKTLEQAAEDLDVAPSSIVVAYYLAETNNDPSLSIEGSDRAKAKKIVAMRKQGVRWKRLSVYSGLSEARVKEIWEEETGIPYNETWVGKGTPPPGMTVEDAREIAAVRPKTADNGDEPVRATSKRSTAKRSSAKAASAAPAKRSTAKRSTAKRSTAKARTRAERLAKSGKDNPS